MYQYQPPISSYAAVQPTYQPQYQPMYQQPSQRGISGRQVASVAEVTVNDVPSDGSAGWFPSSDGSCVWSKKWRSDGTIETVRYVPEAVPEPEPQPDRIDEIMERLDSIEAALKAKKKGAKDE